MELELVISFLGASILLSLMPGPDNIFVLTESLTKGDRNGIAISIGLSSGVLIHTMAAALGLSIIIQQSDVIFSILKYIGAGYLFYLAYQSFNESAPTINLNIKDSCNRSNFISLVRKGFLMNVLNPKVSLFFIAFLPQFVSKDGINVTLQMIILGAIFMAQALIVFCLIAILSGKFTRYINNPKFWNISKWSKIVILSSLAIGLLVASKP